MPLALPLLGVLLLCLVPLASASAASGSPFPVPLLHQAEFTYSVRLYHPTPPPETFVTEARDRVTAKYKELISAPKAGGPSAQVDIRSEPTEDLDLMPERLMYFFARRLDPAERQRLLGSRHATRLVFRVPFARRDEVLLSATRLCHELATASGAFLWDIDTREYFTPERWKAERLEGWTGGTPNVPSHVTFHVYGEDDGVRFVSLGMVKLGLPDLVVEDVPRSMTVPMGTVLNGVAQLLAEGLGVPADGTLTVDLSRVKDARMRKQLEGKSTPGAVRKLKLRALEARRESGDPDNALLEVSFPGEGSTQARQLAALDTLLGKRADSLTPVPPGDPELAAVARKARARLLELRPKLEKGVAPPEALVIKAGFPTDTGSSEHMWFTFTAWEKDRLRGTLANEPFGVSKLRLGSSVSVALDDVDDYRYTRADGTEEGGESSRILERRQGVH